MPFVVVQLARLLPRPTGARLDRQYGVEQRLEELAVVHVCGAEQERERDAASVDQGVALGARLAAVSWVRAAALGPFAGKEALRASTG